MKLLVKRDPTYLVETEGSAELDSDVPKFLGITRVVSPDWVSNAYNRHPEDDLVLTGGEDDPNLDLLLNHPLIYQFSAIPGVWSGYRSVVVGDGKGELYRLKGVSFSPEKPYVQNYDDGTWEVFGGQPLQSARFEKDMSDRFNRILSNEGIVPVMTCKGYWHYPKKVKNRKLAASVVKVEGDTRLDEFMFLVENYFAYRVKVFERKNRDEEKIPINEEGNKLMSDIKYVYNLLGMSVGNLKSLMDKNNQTWSADNERSNAHIGNIVLYRDGSKVKVGFVDFDASCDTNDFSRSKIKEMQKREYDTIINSASSGPISMRHIQLGFLKDNTISIGPQFREAFISGFRNGYSDERKAILGLTTEAINSHLDFSEFLKIFEILRGGLSLIPEPVRSEIISIMDRPGGLESLIYEDKFKNRLNYLKEDKLNCIIKEDDESINYINKDSNKLSNIYSILNTNKKYQDNLKRGYTGIINYIR